LDYSKDAVVSPGGYTEVVVLVISHGLAGNNENVTLNSTAPTGITVGYHPTSPVVVSGASTNTNVTLIVSGTSSVPVGNDTVTIKATSGSISQSATFNLRVVQYRVVLSQNTFLPQVQNVTVGGTVYWQNLDGPAAGCAGKSAGTGQHSVVFTTIPGANSSAISQFAIYSYTFNTAGSYFYYSSLDSDHSMNGTINVLTANGGFMGMSSPLPVFSYFKGGSPTITPVPIGATADEPVSTLAGASPLSAGGSALTGMFGMSAHVPKFSVLAFEAGPIVFLSLILSCVALAMLTLGKRGLTTLGTGLSFLGSLSRAQRDARQRAPTHNA